MTGPACGNNPNYRMSDGDRRVVESFRAYLAARAALIEAADWYAQQGKTILAAAQVATDLRRRAGAEARHVDGSTATETDEQRADREETERDHARGDHTHCGVTCEVELPTEHLRNFVIAKGYPGTKGALAELERRAADTGGFELRGDTEIRAAALREAADIAEAQRQFEPAYGARKSAQVSENVGILRVAAELRRVADGEAAGARQDGADHVCNSVMARGHMDEPLGYFICGICGTPKNGAQLS